MFVTAALHSVSVCTFVSPVEVTCSVVQGCLDVKACTGALHHVSNFICMCAGRNT